jgi:sporulation-control protein spo0M
MSFFGKLKQGLGIGTASVELTIPAHVDKAAGVVNGKVALVAKSAQKVKSVKVVLTETYTSGTGENRKVREFVLGEMSLGDGNPFDLTAEERRELEFALPFSMKLSSAQALAEKGGVLGALGKAAVFAGNEKSEFHVKASADLEGVALDPVDVKHVHLA